MKGREKWSRIVSGKVRKSSDDMKKKEDICLKIKISIFVILKFISFAMVNK